MTAAEFILKRVNPSSGKLTMGVINLDAAAELMEEYARIYHAAKGKKDGDTNVNEYEVGYKSGWDACLRIIKRQIEKPPFPFTYP